MACLKCFQMKSEMFDSRVMCDSCLGTVERSWPGSQSLTIVTEGNRVLAYDDSKSIPHSLVCIIEFHNDAAGFEMEDQIRLVNNILRRDFGPIEGGV